MAAAQVDLRKQKQETRTEFEKIADNVIQRLNSTFRVKPKQAECMSNVVYGKDTLAILPTSYGKSLIYQMLPSLFLELKMATNPLIIIISPLKALIKNQLDEVKELETYFKIKGCSLDDHNNVESIKTGGFNLIFGIPEVWLSSPVKEILASSYFRRNLVCVVVDEAHKVSWGVPGSSNGEAVFREAFGRIVIGKTSGCQLCQTRPSLQAVLTG
ncbi:ATP-dependent DNA helicase RecQ-like [Clytia hemisphaerica]|uniref:ATP-dependent DNA helicase RecQ-like n=1 Tax=Clytia hemisphaerica TaxID=252671 RepID=UPI0034D679CB